MKLNKYYNMLRLKKFANLAISVTAIASLLIILFSIYGSKVGNFVVSIQEQNRYTMSLCENSTFDKSFSRLSAEGMNKMTDSTLGDFFYDNNDRELLTSTDGSHNDYITHIYFAYTFYLKNNSSTPINYSVSMSIDKVSKNADEAIRVMILRNNEAEKIYAKPRPDGLPEEHYGIDYAGNVIIKGYSTISFQSAVTVFSEARPSLHSYEVDKYTVIIWLEGCDEQCSNDENFDIMGGMIKMSMEFSVV